MDNRNGCKKVITCEVVDCTIVKKVCVGTPIRSVTSSVIIKLGGISGIKQGTAGLTTDDPFQPIDTFDEDLGVAHEYLAQITTPDGKTQVSKLLMMNLGSDGVKIAEYGVLRSADDLGDFCAEYVDGSVQLKFSPTYPNTTVKYTRILNEPVV